MIKKEILEIIKKKELDIRKRGPLPRPFDQKLTPDVITTVAKAIISIGSKFKNSLCSKP